MFAFLLVSLGWMVGSGCRTPEPTLEVQGRPSEILRVGTSGDYRPFSWREAERGAEPMGFSITLARAYAADTGRHLDWVPFRWSRLTRDLGEERFDLVLSGVTVRADRSVSGRFSVPVTVSGAVALVPDASSVRDADALDRTGLRIAVNAGGHLERTARRLFPHATIEPVPRNGAVLERLDDGRADAVLTDDLEAPHWQARRAGLRAIGPLTRDRKAAWFPIDRTAERARFDRWLLETERDGRLAEWRTAWGLPAEATAAPLAALLASLDERLSLMQGVAAAKHVLDRPIEDRPREERVLEAAGAAVRREAEERRWPAPDPQATRRFYRAQIEAAKAIQRAWSPPPGSRETFDAAARRKAEDDLTERLRPALLALGERVALLVVLAHHTHEGPPGPERVERALARHGLPRADLEAIRASLVDLLAPERATAAPRTRTASR